MSVSFPQHTDEPWFFCSDSIDETASWPDPQVMRLEILEDLKPLDGQFGVFPKLTVPDALHEVLFSQPELGLAAHEEDGRHSSSKATLYTYGILDAAKVENLPALLADSGLQHRCLFKGDAYIQLSEAAPWLVRLEEGNSFTRSLFTRTTANWHLWDREAGVYIRSYCSLDDIWRHFRRFTRVRDESGAWFLQRFWEPRSITVYADSSASPFADPCVVRAVAINPRTGQGSVLVPQIRETPAASPVLLRSDRRRFDDSATANYAEVLATTLFNSVPAQSERLGLETSEPLARSILAISGMMEKRGINRGADVARICACAFFYGTHFLNDPRIAPMARETLNSAEPSGSLRALRFEEALRGQPRHTLVVTSHGLERLTADLEYLQANGRLPRLSPADTGFVSAEIYGAFESACQSGWHQAGLSANEDSLRRQAYFRMAVLWTPWFMQDPLHAACSETLMQIPRDDRNRCKDPMFQ